MDLKIRLTMTKKQREIRDARTLGAMKRREAEQANNQGQIKQEEKDRTNARANRALKNSEELNWD